MRHGRRLPGLRDLSSEVALVVDCLCEEVAVKCLFLLLLFFSVFFIPNPLPCDSPPDGYSFEDLEHLPGPKCAMADAYPGSGIESHGNGTKMSFWKETDVDA
jgi:hypothetical protein